MVNRILSAWSLAVLAILVLTSLLVAGCGGSTGSGTNTFKAPIDFGNLQTGAIDVTESNGTVSGTLVVNDSTPPPMRPTDGGFPQLPPGAYNLTGTLTPPNGFELAGELPAPQGSFTLTGTLPSTQEEGHYVLTIDGTVFEGSLPRIQVGVAIDPDDATMEKGTARTFRAELTHAPAGNIRYFWFVSAPAAYLVDPNDGNTGANQLETDSDQISLQTTMQDFGTIRLYVRAFKINPDNSRTFLGEGSSEIHIPDLDILIPTWVHETAQYPPDPNLTVHAYLWEFPVVPGAHDYVVTIKNPQNQTLQVYRLLQGDVENTEVTTIPYINMNYPFPPTIPVHDELTGVVRHNFIRRGNAIRMLVVFGDGFDPEVYRTSASLSVVVNH